MSKSEYYSGKDITGFVYKGEGEALHILKRPDGQTRVGITYYEDEKLLEEDEEMGIYLKDEDMKVLYEFIGKYYEGVKA